jgi:Pentapeptide repeats (8 copies)
MAAAENPPRPKTPEDERRRARRRRSKLWATWAQVVATPIAAVAVLIAVWVAWQGQTAINRNSQSALRQSEDSQLSVAITALGSRDTAQRIAGLLLLEHNTYARLELTAQTGESPAEVYEDYVTALQILSGYLRSHSDAITSQRPHFSRGYGTLSAPGIIPLDVAYAADEVRFLVDQQTEAGVQALHVPEQPAIDLSYDELYGIIWSDIHFGWVSVYMPGTDLRGGNLSFSQWHTGSDLSHDYLQCANLHKADFRGVNLSGADLRGADVRGADFRGANLQGAKLTQVYGTATWPRSVHVTSLPVSKWKPHVCLGKSAFWDPQPPPAPTPHPTSSSSPSPRPSAGKGK